MRAPPSPPHPTGLRWSRPGAIVAPSTTPSPRTAWRTKRWTPRPPRSPQPPPGPRTAAAHVEHARAQRAASVRADLVAALRPNLVVGEECPVCAQAVAVLPERLPEGDLAAADRALAAAEAALDAPVGPRRPQPPSTRGPPPRARPPPTPWSASRPHWRDRARHDLADPDRTRPDPTIPTTVTRRHVGLCRSAPESTSTLAARRAVDEAVASPAGRAPPESTWRRTP